MFLRRFCLAYYLAHILDAAISWMEPRKTATAQTLHIEQSPSVLTVASVSALLYEVTLNNIL